MCHILYKKMTIILPWLSKMNVGREHSIAAGKKQVPTKMQVDTGGEKPENFSTIF
jgi:hypothetical protein